jgi:integrase
MTLYKRGNTWWYRFTDANGTLVRESAKTSDKKLAERIEMKHRQELIESHKLGIAPDRPFEEAVKFFLRKKDLEKLRSVDCYDQQLRWWTEKFKNTTLQQIDEAKIVAAINDKAKEKTHMGSPKPATLNRYLSALRACLNAAEKARWIVRAPKIEEYKEPKVRVRWLTLQERARLLGAAPDHWAALIRFSLATGLRQSNVVELRWQWVDMGTRTLTVPGAYFKNGNEFCIPLSEEAMLVLREQLNKHHEFVFTYQGRPMPALQHTEWKSILAKADITNFRWHDLRHTWATDMVKAGCPLHVLQKLGGWETIQMVMKYAHHDVESLRQFVEAQNWHSEPRNKMRLVRGVG